MIIDNKGKLFGKISIIDLLIVVVIIGAIAGVGYKFTRTKTASPLFNQAKDIQITFYAEEVPDFAANAVKDGDIAKDSVKGAVFGKVVSKKIDKSISWATNEKGEFVVSSRPGYSLIYVTVDGKGLLDSTGLTVDNADYYIGQSINLRVGGTALYVRISDVKIKG